MKGEQHASHHSVLTLTLMLMSGKGVPGTVPGTTAHPGFEINNRRVESFLATFLASFTGTKEKRIFVAHASVACKSTYLSRSISYEARGREGIFVGPFCS
jgi:hypothetical protein